MVDVIAQRFISLRKHLSERLDIRLTMELLAEKAGIPSYKMEGLEHGKGTWSSHLALLQFFRSQGYNLDWIVAEDNSNIPMILPAANDLLVIAEKIRELGNRYDQDYQELGSLMKNSGVEAFAAQPAGGTQPELLVEARRLDL